MHLSPRHLLRLGGAALAGASVAPAVACAQTPKRGGTPGDPDLGPIPLRRVPDDLLQDAHRP